ncbi:ABC transporter ATP-binding protein [Lacticaseibacillus zhaodongensis]|uniref:ABC transporter ATP-binding protein n=1 Tax=Lacticaseibacillus zhaodongensis TaxID=2668065 RepID=UPI0012D2A127|nr:ABC transporter ATP-binding protein [Lacticaseibacillus zhaodongensis]
MKTLWPYLRRFWRAELVATIATIIMAFASLWQPHLLQQVMAAIIANRQQQVLHLGIELIVFAALGIVAGVVNTVFSARAAVGIATALRSDLYKQVQSFAFADIETFAASKLVVRMTNDINQVQGMVMAVFQIVARVPIMFIGALTLALLTVPSLWWLLAIMLIIIVVIAIVGMKRMSKYFGAIQARIDDVNTIARENLMGVRVVKSFVQEDAQIKQFTSASDKMNALAIKIGYTFSVMMPGFFLIGYLAMATAILVIGQSLRVHPAYLAAVASFTGYLMQLLMAVINASFIASGTTRAFVSLGRIGEVFAHKPSMHYPDVPVVNLPGSIEFDHVDFSYPGASQPTLHDINFKVAPGQMVGIVGATGSGKTSLAQLIPRLFDATKGVVKVGGSDVRTLAAGSLRQTVAMVMQRSTLFSGTIASNLRQGKPDATTRDMHWAADIAQSSEFIRRLDAGFNAQVEERSANFSGGQKQRLAITRGVIAHPKVLIMDDSTSALDARSERLVQEALDRELKDTTTVIIAEKIASIIKADQILVLDGGRLIARGTHKELLKTSPEYRAIYQTQKAREGVFADA